MCRILIVQYALMGTIGVAVHPYRIPIVFPKNGPRMRHRPSLSRKAKRPVEDYCRCICLLVTNLTPFQE